MAVAQDQPPQTLTLPAALYPRGFGRIVDGLFMSCWLVLWVAGEVAVVTLLGTTIISLIAAILDLSLPSLLPAGERPWAWLRGSCCSARSF